MCTSWENNLSHVAIRNAIPNTIPNMPSCGHPQAPGGRGNGVTGNGLPPNPPAPRVRTLRVRPASVPPAPAAVPMAADGAGRLGRSGSDVWLTADGRGTPLILPQTSKPLCRRSPLRFGGAGRIKPFGASPSTKPRPWTNGGQHTCRTDSLTANGPFDADGAAVHVPSTRAVNSWVTNLAKRHKPRVFTLNVWPFYVSSK